MGKIIIKHYLNKTLKPSLMKGVFKYPVYVRVTYNRMNHKLKSQWINYPVSESEFGKTAIKKIAEYETNIITTILEYEKEIDKINITSRLTFSFDYVSKCFLSHVLGENKVKEQIISFIEKKTELDDSVISPYVRLDYIEAKGWFDLAEKGVFIKEYQSKIIFLGLLMEFEKLNYHFLSEEYEPHGIFNFYEWFKNSGKERFIKFALDKAILKELEIISIAEMLDKQIVNWIAFDFMAERI